MTLWTLFKKKEKKKKEVQIKTRNVEINTRMDPSKKKQVLNKRVQNSIQKVCLKKDNSYTHCYSRAKQNHFF
mgnify:CR=1 FL=1